MPFKKINIEGQRYGYLTVIKRTNKLSKHGQAYFLCLCDCGKEKEICMGGLRKGDTVSCGCYRKRKVFIHGHRSVKGKKSPTLTTYSAMLNRCYNPKQQNYNRYGGAIPPVKVCARWRRSFVNFLKDMGERPKGKTLGRKRGVKLYSKANCEWQTPKEQAADKVKKVIK